MSAAYYDDVQQIYVAYYGRPADPAGQASWAAILAANNGDLKAIINAFGTSAESTALYAGTTSAAKITAIYNQLFNRAPDSAGLAFYTAELDAKRMTASSIALNIADGAKGVDATYLSNKLTVADAFTAALTADSSAAAAYTLSTAGTARSLLSGVTTSAATTNVNAAVAAIKAGGGTSSVTGSIYTLTNDSDVVEGTANADWIRAVAVVDTAATAGKVTSLSDDDYIDGGAGDDKLSVYFSSAAGITAVTFAGTLTDVEEIEILTAGTDATLDITGASLDGLETITVSKNKDNEVTVLVGDLTDISVSLNGVGTSPITVEAETNDAVFSLTVLNSAAGTTGVNFELDATTAITALELTVAGDVTFSNLDLDGGTAGGTASTLTTVTITGTGDVDLADALTDDDLESLNAAGLAGGLAVSLDGTALTELIGGAGDDAITLDVGTSAEVVVDLGEGDDALDISAATDEAVAGFELDGGAGVDTITVSGATTGVVTAVLDVATGFERLALTGASVAASTPISFEDLSDAGFTAVGLADDGSLFLAEANGANLFLDAGTAALAATLELQESGSAKNDTVVIDLSTTTGDTVGALDADINTYKIETVEINAVVGSGDITIDLGGGTGTADSFDGLVLAKNVTIEITADTAADTLGAVSLASITTSLENFTLTIGEGVGSTATAVSVGALDITADKVVIDIESDNVAIDSLTTDAADVSINLGGATNVITAADLESVEQLTIDTAGTGNSIVALTAGSLADLTINITDGDFTMSGVSMDLLETLTITGGGDLTALTLATDGTESVLTEVDLSDFTGEVVLLDLDGMASTGRLTMTLGDFSGDTANITLGDGNVKDTVVVTTDGSIRYAISNFDVANDRINLSEFGLDYNDDATAVTIDDVDDLQDGEVEITFEGADFSIVLVGVTSDDISSALFIM